MEDTTNKYITRTEHEEFMKRMEDEHKRIHFRIHDNEKMIDKIYDLTLSVERLATSVETMTKEQKEHQERLENLENRDGEMWRKMSGYVLTTLVGAIIMFVLMKIGISM